MFTCVYVSVPLFVCVFETVFVQLCVFLCMPVCVVFFFVWDLISQHYNIHLVCSLYVCVVLRVGDR